MAARRETPRQKMIGMMYLVLTAMLALNVSKDALDAFVLVNEGITKTNLSFEAKNAHILKQFDEQMEMAPAKVAPLRQRAIDISQKSDELYIAIELLKREIITMSEPDGEDAIAIRNPKFIYYDSLRVKDNMDYPSQIMIRENKGVELKEKINAYSDFLLSHISERETGLRNSIVTALSTPDIHEKGEKVSWESHFFENLPLIAVLTNMSQYQSYIRNSEMEALTYLYSRIDAEAFKFDKLEPIVVPNSNFILKGNEYVANISVAAYDTSRYPVVMIGRHETITLPDGSKDYKMVGSYTELPVVNGKAVYRRAGASVGFNSWGGLIQVHNSDGSVTKMPFSQEYQVGEASTVISPTKMNVFYIGVDNPVDISISGVPKENMEATINNGTIVRDENGFIVRPSTPGTAIVTVMAKTNGQMRQMREMLFRVKTVPNPVAKLAGRTGGIIDKSTLSAQLALQPSMDGFDFDIKFNISEFTLSASQGDFVREARSTSAALTDEQKNIIRSLTKGQKVYIDNIIATGPDGIRRELNPIIFKIN